MTGIEIGLVSLLALVVLIYLGTHVPVAMLLVSFVSVWLMRGNFRLAEKLLASTVTDGIASYNFAIIPLFVLMGLLVTASDLGKDAFAAASRLFYRLPGGLGVATVAANAVFAAISGISIASAAVFSKVAVPEMVASGMSKSSAVGIVAGSSVLGMLIPPSLLMIVYAVLTEQSVGDMFLAGIGPGICLTALFSVTIVALERNREQPAPPAADPDRSLFGQTAPIACLAMTVLGGIYGGLFTPTEAGAVGATGALLIALLKRRFSFGGFLQVLIDTGYVTASICMLVIGAAMYSRMLAMSGLTSALSDVFQTYNLPFWQLLLVYLAVVLVLGTILDSVSIMLILIPLILPTLVAQGIDLVWFGIITIVAVEIGLLTPPFGLSVYVVKATIDDPDLKLSQIFRGAAPYVAAMFILLALMIVFPSIVTAFL